MNKQSSSRMWRSYVAPRLDPIQVAALEAFAEKGYAATSVRELATRCGMSVSGVYHHYASKQRILSYLLHTTMRGLLRRSEEALEEAGDDPRTQFMFIIECLVLFHAYRRDQAFVASTEIRSLTKENRQSFTALRDRQQSMLDNTIVQGIEADQFKSDYPMETGRAIATMCMGVASWYRPDSPQTPEEIAAQHVQFGLRLLSAG